MNNSGAALLAPTIEEVRSDFPALNRSVNGTPLIYCDYAATTPKPKSVIDTVTRYYSTEVGNPGRSTHYLAAQVSRAIDNARYKVLEFVQASSDYAVSFSKNATESLNMAAYALTKAAPKITHIITTISEHHANFLPWVRLHKELNIPLTVIPVDKKTGKLRYNDLDETLEKKTKRPLLAITGCSNVTGAITDVAYLAKLKEKYPNLIIVLDATQLLQHTAIDLTETPVDLLAASAHKLYGPEGVGFFVYNKNIFQNLEPQNIGGGMIEKVTLDEAIWAPDERRFEAGTPNTAGIVGTKEAIEYIQTLGYAAITARERQLHDYFLEKLRSFPDAIHLLGDHKTDDYAPVFSLTGNVHPHDIASFLDERGIAIRAGHHCAAPLHQMFNVPASARFSLSFLNTTDDIDYVFEALVICLVKYQK